jgi:hypothetical protein
MIKKSVLASVAGATLVTAVLAGSPANAAPAVPGSVNRGTSFSDHLTSGQYIQNAGFRLVMQSDGNLVEYRLSNAKPCFDSHTHGQPGNYVTFWRAWPSSTASMDVRGRDGTIKISYVSHSGGSNVNINSKGEVWVGYARLTNNHFC